MKCKIEGVRIAALASVLPKKEIAIDSYTEFFGEKKVKRLKRSTGVESVHVVSLGETAADLCFSAAKHIFEAGEITRESVDAIVFVSISPDYRAPGNAGILQERLGLSQDVVALDLTFGCSAYPYGLYEAAMLIKAGGCNRVLLCNGDTQSTLVNDKDRAMKMLVGDAGTATIVEAGEDTWNFYIKTVGKGYKDLIIPAGGCRLPSTEETRREQEDEDGNIRRLVDLYMNGGEVMNFSLTEVPIAVESLCQQMNVTKKDIDLFALHQPNKLILDFLQNGMELDEHKCPVGIGNVGNTASASIPLLLTTLKSRGYDYLQAKRVIACGFGIGLSVAAVSLNLSETKIFEPIIK